MRLWLVVGAVVGLSVAPPRVRLGGGDDDGLKALSAAELLRAGRELGGGVLVEAYAAEMAADLDAASSTASGKRRRARLAFGFYERGKVCGVAAVVALRESRGLDRAGYWPTLEVRHVAVASKGVAFARALLALAKENAMFLDTTSLDPRPAPDDDVLNSMLLVWKRPSVLSGASSAFLEAVDRVNARGGLPSVLCVDVPPDLAVDLSPFWFSSDIRLEDDGPPDAAFYFRPKGISDYEVSLVEPRRGARVFDVYDDKALTTADFKNKDFLRFVAKSLSTKLRSRLLQP